MLSALKRLVRAFWLRVRFAGSSVHVHPTAYVARRAVVRAGRGGSITIGAHCEIHEFAMLLAYGGEIVIGDHSSVNPFTVVYGHGGTRIGSGVRIAAHTVIIPANHVRGDEHTPLHQQGVTARGIAIDDHVWIGAGCRILDGATIGRNAVIGAGSVVTRSIPANATAMGVPARVL